MKLFGRKERHFDFSMITVVSGSSSKYVKKIRNFIDRLKKQTLGIENVELLIICPAEKAAKKQFKELQKEYPETVKLVKVKEVSSDAVKEAASLAGGDYIAFPELSAKYSKKTLETTKSFFAENDVPIVKIPVFVKGEGCVDRSYLTNPKVVELGESPKYATLDINSCFFQKECVFEFSGADFAFDVQAKYGCLGINSKAKYTRKSKSPKNANLYDLKKIASKAKKCEEIAINAAAKFGFENGIDEVQATDNEKVNLYIEKINEKIAEIKKDREYDYKISVIIPVYKVEKYVEETFASIRRQNIGFFENVQVIFVDDGSPDKSGEICDKIAKKYPENVICIHKENGGVSSARNTGLDYARGKYINFCDPDDYFKHKSTFTKMYDFMQEHGDEVDFVTMPIYFFEAKNGGHQLNNKFANGTRVIDLRYEPQYVQLHLAPSFFKSEVIKRYRFNTSLKVSEDADVVIRILSEKMKFGVRSEVKYMYRKRDDGSSALQGSMNNLSYFVDSMEKYMLKLIADFKDENDRIPEFLQYDIAYEIQWRVSYSKDLNATILNDKQCAEYIQNIKKALSYVDDSVITNSPYANFERKYKMLEVKGTLNPHTEFIWQNPDGYRYVLMSSNLVVGDYSKNPVTIYTLDIIGKKLIIEGSTAILHGLFDKVNVYLTFNGKPIETERIASADYSSNMLGKPIFDNYVFRAKIDLSEIKSKSGIQLLMDCDDITIHKINIGYYHLCNINNKCRNQYLYKNGYLLFASNNNITVEPATEDILPSLEMKLQNEIMEKKNEESAELVRYRQEYFEQVKNKTKPVWLISDRIVKADDNGKAFFKYVMEDHADDVDAYFVLSHESVDYDALSKIGPVLDYGSHEHLLKMLLADKFISSSADENVLNPFAKNKAFIRGLLNYDFIFLQHGVTKDNISGWLGKFRKNIKGFITSAKAEYDSIVNGVGYNYSPENVWLTGMPRFDLLYHDEKNYITLMPTWRKYLLTDYDYSTGNRESTKALLDSEYVKFYSSLMSSKKLLDAADKFGYKIKFMPHPGMMPIADVFKRDPRVELFDFDTSYKDVYAKSNLIVTDYSSAVFDFVYLKKPIMYCQFDSESFFAGEHVYTKGYFDYERDGFGEVEYDLDSTIDRIIEYMQNGCRLKDKYRERIDNFFAFNDKGSCERIYRKIIEMDKHD